MNNAGKATKRCRGEQGMAAGPTGVEVPVIYEVRDNARHRLSKERSIHSRQPVEEGYFGTVRNMTEETSPPVYLDGDHRPNTDSNSDCENTKALPLLVSPQGNTTRRREGSEGGKNKIKDIQEQWRGALRNLLCDEDIDEDGREEKHLHGSDTVAKTQRPNRRPSPGAQAINETGTYRRMKKKSKNTKTAGEYTHASIVVTWDKKTIMVNEKNGTCWFPGGGRKPGETARQCAVRELWEESGYEAKEEDLIQLRDLITVDFRCAIFALSIAAKSQVTRLRNREKAAEGKADILSAEWIQIDIILAALKEMKGGKKTGTQSLRLRYANIGKGRIDELIRQNKTHKEAGSRVERPRRDSSTDRKDEHEGINKAPK